MKRVFLTYGMILIIVCIGATWLVIQTLEDPRLQAAALVVLAAACISSMHIYHRIWSGITRGVVDLWQSGAEEEALDQAGSFDMQVFIRLEQGIRSEREAMRGLQRRHRLLMQIMERLRTSTEPVSELTPLLVNILVGIRDGGGFEALYLFFYNNKGELMAGGLETEGAAVKLDHVRPMLEPGGDWAAAAAGRGLNESVQVKSASLSDREATLIPVEDQHGRMALIAGLAPAGASATSASGEAAGELASYIAFAVREAEMLEKLFSSAHWDPATCTYKHIYFHDRIHDEIDRAKRYDYKFSIIIIRIINGEPTTDRLGRLGGMINGNKRSIDLLARFGTEQLALLLPQTSTEQASIMARRIVDIAARELDQQLALAIVEYPTDGLKPLELTDKAFELATRLQGPSIRTP